MQTKGLATDWRTHYRYAVYKRKVLAADGSVIVRPFIVIKNGYDVIVRFTNLHKYAGVFEGRTIAPMSANAEKKLYYICQMLNYILIERYSDFGTDHIFEITREMLEHFFKDYAETELPSGGFRGAEGVGRCISVVAEFFRKLAKKFGQQMKLTENDLLIEQNVYTRRDGIVVKKVPTFQVRSLSERKSIFRELPTDAFKILLNLAFRYAPDIAFALCLQAFAGLRASEVCNVRQEASPYGAGLTLTRIGREVRKVEIDLTRELPMRNDGVTVGRIKKERRQFVYPPFLDAFAFAYEHHKEYLAKHRFEQDYCPMFINARGKAMTYEDYNNRFRKLVDEHFRHRLLASEDAELRLYGQLLYENRLGLHALRHWFSVQLVLHGEDIAQIQYWRGDSNPESALTYLQNKGELVKELKLVSDNFIEILLADGEKNIGYEYD